MEIFPAEDYGQMSGMAAQLVIEQVKAKPGSVIGLVTGGTTEGMYRQLVESYRQGQVSFGQVKTVNTDEYYKIAPDNDQSYQYYMQQRFFSQVDIKAENTLLVDGLAADPAEECARYDRALVETGPMDLLILGMGGNGHIAFNEPQPDCFERNTHLVKLTDSTIHANSRFFERWEDIPKYAITMGIGPMMAAKKIVFLVSGEGKSDMLQQALHGPVTPMVPASILQFHQNLTVIADKAALTKVVL